MEQLLYIIPLSIIPALVYCVLLYFNLPYKTVNLKVALWHILLGTLSIGIILTFFQMFPWWTDMAKNIANPIFERSLYLHIKFYLEVGVLEETCKLVTFLLIAKYRHDNKKDVRDTAIGTIVYVGMVSLGFAVIENIMYAIGSRAPITVLGWRSFTAVVAHLLFGLYMGYFIVRSRMINYRPKSMFTALINRFPRGKKVFFTLFGLFVASMIHGLYDLQLVANSPNGLSGAYILFAALMVGLIICYRDILKRIKNL